MEGGVDLEFWAWKDGCHGWKRLNLEFSGRGWHSEQCSNCICLLSFEPFMIEWISGLNFRLRSI